LLPNAKSEILLNEHPAEAFVGAAPLVHDESDISYKVHMTGAWTCAVCSQLLILVTNPIILLGWIPFTIYYLVTMLLNR